MEDPWLTTGSLPVAPRSRGWDALTMCHDSAPDRVWIEIDPSADPISGVMHHGSEPARQFDGWLELVALLETERLPGSGPIVPGDQG